MFKKNEVSLDVIEENIKSDNVGYVISNNEGRAIFIGLKAPFVRQFQRREEIKIGRETLCSTWGDGKEEVFTGESHIYITVLWRRREFFHKVINGVESLVEIQLQLENAKSYLKNRIIDVHYF